MSDKIQFLPIEDMFFDAVVSSLSETQDWGLLYTGVPEAQKHTKGEEIIVGILDTGGPDHVDLNENALSPVNCSTSPDAYDHQGHGTHVAGIIAAVENGVGIIGVAPKAKVVGIKVLGEGGVGTYDQIINGVNKAVELKVDIINMSLGSPLEPPQLLHDAIKRAYDAGIIVVAAAGNDSGAVNYPARYEEVIAVAAIDQQGNLARFSSRGDQVSVVAPGVSIYSTYLNNQYVVLNGTSQASPLIAGICALLISWVKKHPENNIVINNGQDMLKLLDCLCDPQGKIGYVGKECQIGFGIPQFANFMPWKEQIVAASKTDEQVEDENWKETIRERWGIQDD